MTKEVVKTENNPQTVQTQSGDTSDAVAWKNLPGRASDYIVEEVESPAGYAFKQVSGSGKQDDPFILTNEKKVVLDRLQSIYVIKNWVDENDKKLEAPTDTEVYVALYRKIGTKVELVESEKLNKKPNPQKVVNFNNLNPPPLWKDVYLPTRTGENGTGETIDYFLKEVNAKNEDRTKENFVTSALTYTNEKLTLKVTFTNKKLDPKAFELSKPISITVNKVWKGGEVKNSQKIKFQLQRKLEGETGFNNVSGGSVVVGDDNTHTWNNLPQVNEKGEKYVYNVIETKTEKNYSPIVEVSDDGKTFTFTNTYEEPVTYHKVIISCRLSTSI